MSTSGSKSNEHVAHFLVDIHTLGFIVREPGNLMREPTVYHFSDKWKDIKDIETAGKIKKELREKINWEKNNRKELAQSYADK